MLSAIKIGLKYIKIGTTNNSEIKTLKTKRNKNDMNFKK